MKIKIGDFRIRPAQKLNLSKRPTEVNPLYKSKADYKAILAKNIERLRAIQSLMYAHNRYSLLLIFQAMDAAGKDGVIKRVMSGVNPQGCQVFSFKNPSAEELSHDFLWRTARCLPERGHIGIFNRSYYEEVLIVRVHPNILQSQGLPNEIANDPNIWKQRYKSIIDHERHLYRNGTRIVKFFLHISKEEQRKRFLARIDDPDKNWKFNRADVEERGRWDDYQQSYQSCLSATTSKFAPWYVIPADDKDNARLITSHIVLDTLAELKMSYPQPNDSQRKELASLRILLERGK